MEGKKKIRGQNKVPGFPAKNSSDNWSYPLSAYPINTRQFALALYSDPIISRVQNPSQFSSYPRCLENTDRSRTD